MGVKREEREGSPFVRREVPVVPFSVLDDAESRTDDDADAARRESASVMEADAGNAPSQAHDPEKRAPVLNGLLRKDAVGAETEARDWAREALLNAQAPDEEEEGEDAERDELKDEADECDLESVFMLTNRAGARQRRGAPWVPICAYRRCRRPTCLLPTLGGRT